MIGGITTPHGTVVARGSRFKAGVELVKEEFKNNIDGRDIFWNTFAAIKNSVTGTVRAVGQIIPSILNAGSKQQFETYREGEPSGIIGNAAGNVIRTAKSGNIGGTISAAVAELPDIATDVPMSALGHAPYSIRAVSDNSRYASATKLAA